MKKLMLVVLMVSALHNTALADDMDVFNQGFNAGASAGYNVCKMETKQKLSSYKDLVNAVFNTKALMFARKFPLPTAVQKIRIVQAQDGTAELIREWDVLPPSDFPLSAVETLKSELTSEPLAKGYAVVVKTDKLPLEQLAYDYYIAGQNGLKPTYMQHLLVLGTFERKPDAERSKEELSAYGVKADVEKMDVKQVKQKSEDVAEKLNDLSNEMIQREKGLIGMQPKTKLSVANLLDYLNKAKATAESLEDNPNYADFNWLKLEDDIDSIKHNVLLYLSEDEPYKKVVLYDPLAEQRQSYQSEVKKLKAENAKLKAEVNRLEGGEQ